MTYATDAIQSRCTALSRIATPLGQLLLARTNAGLAGAWFAEQKHHPAALDAPERDDDPLLADAASQLHAYFAGERSSFDLALDLHGTPFQRSVWAELLRIAPGSTCSYGAIARRLAMPAASRAVGAAVGRNPLSIIVPCHRVVGSTGSLTGYAGGLDRKTALLRLESAHATTRRHEPHPMELH